jgi:hypothetical protein
MELQQQHAAVRVRAQAHFTVVLSEPAHLGSPLKIAAHRRVVTDQVEAQAATVNDVLDPAEQVRGMGRRWEPCTSGWSPTGPFTDRLASTGSSAGRAGPLSGSGRQNLSGTKRARGSSSCLVEFEAVAVVSALPGGTALLYKDVGDKPTLAEVVRPAASTATAGGVFVLGPD